MSRDRTLTTLAELVSEATAIVDPTGADPAVVEFQQRYEDDEAPVRAVLPELEERLRWGADDHPPVVVAQAIVLYLGHRLHDSEDDPEQLLQHVARAEFHETPDPPIAQWFTERGIEVRATHS